MASRIFTPGVRALASASAATSSSLGLRGTVRSFSQTPARLADAAAPLPARKPVGAFRGGLFGFLLGSTLAGGAVYYYVLQEYKASNDLLTEDIYALQRATQHMSSYLTTLEEKIETMERKKK